MQQTMVATIHGGLGIWHCKSVSRAKERGIRSTYAASRRVTVVLNPSVPAMLGEGERNQPEPEVASSKCQFCYSRGEEVYESESQQLCAAHDGEDRYLGVFKGHDQTSERTA